MKMPTSSRNQASDDFSSGNQSSGKQLSDNQPVEAEFLFRLYTSGHSPNSERARRQLVNICEAYLCSRYRIEYVDVWENPNIALADRVFATPAVRKVRPAPTTLIFGDLTEVDLVLDAFGIEVTPE